MSSTDDTTPSPDIYDPYPQLGIIKNPDGSFTRIPEFIPTRPASSDPSNPVLTKDIPINEHNNTWARLYLPQPPPPTKLPVIVFYHGGGFLIASAASSFFHNFCTKIVLQTPALMVSIDYRLAPEHRLPAAYDDCLEALHWLRSAASAVDWLADHADLSKCFILGNSAGGNIAYHVGLRVAASSVDLTPLRIRGLVLHQAYFGGVNRTASEARSVNDKVVPLHKIDVSWGLALPDGADRDHEYCNPTVRGIDEVVVDKIKGAGWKVLVTGYEGDPFVDRQVQVANMLKDKGIDVIEHFRSGACHGIEFYDESGTYTDIFVDVLKKFVA